MASKNVKKKQYKRNQSMTNTFTHPKSHLPVENSGSPIPSASKSNSSYNSISASNPQMAVWMKDPS
jgi:hypothetical protein